MNLSEKQKMLTGQLYLASDAELMAERERAGAWMARYSGATGAERDVLLAEGLGTVGRGVEVRAPFHCDYGYNIHLEDGVFLNFGCVILDVCSVHIGAGCQVGPAVQIYTADHPRDPRQRRAGLEYGRPVVIGKNAWIGGGAIILPGVVVGDDAIIGAGSVLTRDVPVGATVLGNPARPR